VEEISELGASVVPRGTFEPSSDQSSICAWNLTEPSAGGHSNSHRLGLGFKVPLFHVEHLEIVELVSRETKPTERRRHCGNGRRQRAVHIELFHVEHPSRSPEQKPASRGGAIARTGCFQGEIEQ